jgi:NAD(P)-dependent dehydrogenase (short-subunit alcohol dehydrogenase family)
MGRAFAMRFARAGMNVALADIDEVSLRPVAEAIEAMGVRASVHRCDVRELDEVERLSNEALKAHDQLNVICNNAGVASRFLGGQIDINDWHWVMDVNFWGVVHGHKVFLPHLMEHGDGHIVNTASMAGHFPAHSPYGASKWAVVGITEGLFHMLADQGSSVGVSCLCPGWVNTKIADSVNKRPEDVAPGIQAEQSPEDAARYEFVRDLIRNGLDPNHVADQVHDAVLSKQFWILTHPEMVEMLPARYDAILKGHNPVRTALS